MHAPPPQQQHYRPHAPPMLSSAVTTGKTPIAKRTRASRRANDDPPAAPNNTTTNNNHPAPPPQIMRNAADDAIAKRRAELRRLQQQRGKSAGIAERLSLANKTSNDHLNHRRAEAAPMMRSAGVSNHNSRFGAAKEVSVVEGGGNVRTARQLDESYSNINNNYNGNGVVMNNTGYGAPPPAAAASQTRATMAVKRTSEIFPPTKIRQQQQQYAVAPPAAMPSNNNYTTTMGSTNHNNHPYQQPSLTPVVPQTTKAPPKQQPPQPVQSPSLNSIQSTSSYGSSSTTSKRSPFGQARVTKVIPALSLSTTGTTKNNGGGVKLLVPPLNMLDVPSLVDEDDNKADDVPVEKNGGAPADDKRMPLKPVGDDTTTRLSFPTNDKKKMPLKRVEDAAKLPCVKDNDGVSNVTKDKKMTTPRYEDEKEEAEFIDSGKSTPIHANLVEQSPVESVVNATTAAAKNGGSTKVEDDGSKSRATVAQQPDVSATLQKARNALVEQKVDDTSTTTVNTSENRSPPPHEEGAEEEEKKEVEENHQPPQFKKEVKHKNNFGNTTNGTNTNNKMNLSRLKLDLERSEKEKLEALEQVAKLKSLLEAGGIGNNGNNGEISSRSTIDSPRRGITSRNGGSSGGGFGGGITTPRGGSTPNRFTPSRGGRTGIPPLGWSTPRSGNSRAGSRSGSPERGHHHSYGLMMSGTPRMRASPLPKQFNRVISDTQLNKKGEGDVDSSAATPQEERVEEEFLVAAARSIPNEYGTTLASYFVRRPHVTDDSLEQNETDALAKLAIDLWGNKCTHLSSGDEYKKIASVFKPESLEIVACIEADGSVFTLSGECNARHGKVSTMSSSFDEDDNADVDYKEYEWSIFDNVEEMDRALGRVSYIDEEGNEREYWLDSIYEEALTTRESYCTSMISAAFTLKEVRGPLAQKREQPASLNQTMQSQPQPMQSFAPPKSTLDGSVNMSHPPLNQQHVPQSNANTPQNQSRRSDPLPKVEMPTNPAPAKKVPLTSKTTSEASSAKEETKQKQSPPPEEYEPSDSAMTVMVVAVFSFFFKLSWLVIKAPFRIASMILAFWIMLIAVRLLCLFLADDNGAWDIGAGVEYEYNMPGIY